MTHNILFVEDSISLRRVHQQYFCIQGYTVATAGDAAEAEKCLRQSHYSIVVTDLRLTDREDLDGLKVLERVKALRPGTPVLVLTASLDPNVHRQVRASGAYDVILKPTPLPEIEMTVRVILDEMYGCGSSRNESKNCGVVSF